MDNSTTPPGGQPDPAAIGGETLPSLLDQVSAADPTANPVAGPPMVEIASASTIEISHALLGIDTATPDPVPDGPPARLVVQGPPTMPPATGLFDGPDGSTPAEFVEAAQDPGMGLEATPRRSRRIVQAGLVIGAVALVAGAAVALPRLTSVGGSETVTGSLTASAVVNRDDPDLLAESTAAVPSGSAALAPAPPIAVQTELGQSSEARGALDDDTEEVTAAPTTTVWVEPALPDSSEWVDGGNGVLVPDILLRIRFCESTNDYRAANVGSSARGAYQFLEGSWAWYGHAERTGVAEAHLASPAEQDEAALVTLLKDGTRPWTASRHCWNDPELVENYATARPRPRPTAAPASEPADEPAADAPSTTTPAATTTTTADTTTTAAETTTTVEVATSDPTTTTTTADTTTTTAETTTTVAETTTTAPPIDN